MARYIDAELIQYSMLYLIDGNNCVCASKAQIDHIPTADVQPVVHGHWVDVRGENIEDYECPVWCSICEKYANEIM